MPKIPLAALNAMPADDFTAALGDVFESSPWVAAGAADARPFRSRDELHRAMTAVVEAAPAARQLHLIRAHPDLAGRAALAGTLTEASRSEQAGAGLDQLTREEYAAFQALNARYTERFGFPFVLAVKGHDKHSILASFERRLANPPERERARALQEIARIARFRLRELVAEPPEHPPHESPEEPT